jgi:antitoxin PrlF
VSTATLTSKGQTTIPKEIRDHLKLRVGDRIDFLIEADGKVTLKPINTDIRTLDGLLASRYRGKSVSVEEMNRSVGRHLAAKYAKATRK